MKKGNGTKETAKTYTAEVSVNSRGFGYLSLPGYKDDIEIQPENLNTALHKDEVEAVVLPRKRTDRRTQGRVIRVVRRFKEKFVGETRKQEGKFFVIPDDYRFYEKIFIENPPTNLAEKLKVYVRLTGWSKMGPKGEVLKIIGVEGQHDVEMKSIVLEKGFETDFPAPAEKEAEDIGKREKPIKEEETKTRRDFRGVTTFTIDPKTAKDFDDAISLREIASSKVPAQKSEIKNPTYEIGIHIADVSHYVKEDSALDKEARERAFSVYLVDRTIP
ncbi:MAG: RNB domain-containing ribonuclease, partial [bacterium]|nr:RNB domain-containing ribonuclease [bacterium]